MMNSNTSFAFLSLFKHITISTTFTILRIILVPFIINGILSHDFYYSFILFLIAALTDIVDGALARYLNEETILGAYLDPLADKFLLLSCFTAFSFLDSQYFKIPTWFTSLLLLKELLLIFGALYITLYKNIFKIKPSIWGKLTTFAQIIFINIIFFLPIINLDQIYFNIILYFILLLSAITFFHYAFTFYFRGLKS